MVVVMQRIYPSNRIDVFGIFDTRELADIEVNKAVKALLVDNIDNPDIRVVKDTHGNYTVYFDDSEKECMECMQFDFSEVEKNKQLRRTYRGNYNVLSENGWESYGNGVFMWQ